jgi:hypothetical protein
MEILNLILIGVISSGITLMYQRGFFPGMIFHSWFRWLIMTKYEILAKILGKCHYCNGFWINIIITFLFTHNWLYFIITSGSWYLCTVIVSNVIECIYVPIIYKSALDWWNSLNIFEKSNLTEKYKINVPDNGLKGINQYIIQGIANKEKILIK